MKWLKKKKVKKNISHLSKTYYSTNRTNGVWIHILKKKEEDINNTSVWLISGTTCCNCAVFFCFFYSNLLLHHLKSVVSVWGCRSSRGPEVAPEVLFSVIAQNRWTDSWSISKPSNDQLDHRRKKQKQLCQRMQVQTRGTCCGFHASASFTVRVTSNNANIPERFEVWRNFPPSWKP